MTCIGKTCLALGILRDDEQFIKQYFNNHIYWITFNDSMADYDIINLLLLLYQTITKQTSLNVNMNLNRRESINISETINKIRQHLRLELLKDDLRETLLVLDNVYKHEIINIFDLECKILITTRDKTFMNTISNNTFIEINTGFNEHETLQLFSTSLSIDIKELPIEANKIHELCKGKFINFNKLSHR